MGGGFLWPQATRYAGSACSTTGISAYARRYYYKERELGWLRYLPFHAFIETFIAKKEQGYASYRVVYAAWHQGLFTSKKATPEQLRFDRNQHHDLMHAGIEPKYLPMSQTVATSLC
jgi:hypothetical protein